MKLLPPLSFGQDDPRNFPVYSGSEKIGFLYTSTYGNRSNVLMDRAVANFLLADLLVTRNLKTLQRGKRTIAEGYNLRQQDRLGTIFQRDPNSGAHLVIRKALQIGAIRREKLPMGIPYGHLESEENAGRIFRKSRRPMSHKIRYFWYLDEDLCRFLEIPFHKQKNNLSLGVLRNFVCVRLNPAIQDTLEQKQQEQCDLLESKSLGQTIYKTIARETKKRACYLLRGKYRL